MELTGPPTPQTSAASPSCPSPRLPSWGARKRPSSCERETVASGFLAEQKPSRAPGPCVTHGCKNVVLVGPTAVAYLDGMAISLAEFNRLWGLHGAAIEAGISEIAAANPDLAPHVPAILAETCKRVLESYDPTTHSFLEALRRFVWVGEAAEVQRTGV